MTDDSSEKASAARPEGAPSSASAPPSRPGRLRRRTAAVATVGGLAVGGALGGLVVSHAAATPGATPSANAGSSASSSSESTSAGGSTSAAATTTPSTSTPKAGGSNENATHEQGETAQRETAENSGQFHGPGGGPGGQHGLSAEDQQVVATAIGITTAQLTTELSGGKTIAQVAQAHGADVNTLISAWVASENKEIDDRVTSGQLSKAQGDQMKAATQQRITDEVNGSRP
ncbi:MAG TPA: hypothetical protein VI316_12730 [Candidatus Dormibacteraeota bacterium]